MQIIMRNNRLNNLTVAYITLTGERIEVDIPLREFASFVTHKFIQAEKPKETFQQIVTDFEYIESLRQVTATDPENDKRVVLECLQPIADKYGFVVETL